MNYWFSVIRVTVDSGWYIRAVELQEAFNYLFLKLKFILCLYGATRVIWKVSSLTKTNTFFRVKIILFLKVWFGPMFFKTFHAVRNMEYVQIEKSCVYGYFYPTIRWKFLPTKPFFKFGNMKEFDGGRLGE